MINVLGFQIKPTIFPDKTSQVWKLDPELVKNLKACRANEIPVTIQWEFENEAELIHVCQLNDLLREGFYPLKVKLNIPYLPYGRQDKVYSNDATFALRTFAHIINMEKFQSVTTIDAHSHHSHLINNLVDIKANTMFLPAKDTVLCYPDQGAEDRYKNQFPNDYIVLDKKRNQSTGNIEGLKFLADNTKHKDKVICIVDDICDGGRTFIEAAKLLKTLEPKDIYLYVSHGIFSKGITPLTDAGITKIFTYKGEVVPKEYYEQAIEEK